METVVVERRRGTFADYLKLPEGAPYQLIGGYLVKDPAPTLRHQDVVGNLHAWLVLFVRRLKLGVVYVSPVDVHLDDEETYQPDIVFVSNGRRRILTEKRIEGAPDLVIEVLSPSTAYYDLKHKRAAYQQHGVREYWIVDPIERSVEIHVNTVDGFVLFEQRTNRGMISSKLLDGFAVEIEELFAIP